MNAFHLNAENFSDMPAMLEPQLEQFKIERKEILRTELLVEELFWRMVNNGHAAQIDIHVEKKFFGGVQVQISAESAAYNPLVEVSDWDEDDEEYYRTLILKANRQKMSWLHVNHRNVVTISVGNNENFQLKLTLAGMVCGIICGLLMREFFSPEVINFVSDDLIKPIYTMFMHALSLVIAPVIFFSVLCGIVGMSAGASVGRIGSKLIGLYLSTSAIAVLVGLSSSEIFFGSDVPQIATISAAQTSEAYEFSMVNFIVDIIPANFVSPIADGNLLQVIFVAVICGIAFNSLGNKIRMIREFVTECNEFFMRLVGMIIFFVPLIAFFSMMTLASETDFATVLTLGKLVIAELFGVTAILIVYAIMILLVGKISPLPFLKKIPSLWPIAFATSSSAVTMPFTMNFCTKKLGIAEKISSFAIPIGTTVNMNGNCIFMPLAVIMFMKMYGVEVDFNALMIIFTMTLSLAIGTPAVPNAEVVCILSILSTFGVPGDIAGLLFCIATFCDRIVTCFNVTGDVASTLTLGRLENSVDEKIYFNWEPF